MDVQRESYIETPMDLSDANLPATAAAAMVVQPTNRASSCRGNRMVNGAGTVSPPLSPVDDLVQFAW